MPRNTRPSAKASAASAGGEYLVRVFFRFGSVLGVAPTLKSLPITIPLISADQRQLDAPPQLHAQKRGIGTTRSQAIGGGYPRLSGIEDHNIRHRSGAE